MNGVKFLLGDENVTKAPMRPYSDEACAFLNELSSVLMKSPAIRAYPDITALAFWCRKSNTHKLKENCPEADERLGRGLCFHIAPGNIPINFAFTYIFGLLSGCSNIVRLPSKRFMQERPVMDAIADTMVKYDNIGRRSAFVRFPADNEITAKFSRMADVRMIWGGDQTIASVKGLSTKPRCIDISFADRYSICILNGELIANVKETAIQRLAEGFYNDTYLMDQNACSSPQMIMWFNDNAQARERFWNSVYDCAQKKYDLQAAVSVDKYAHMCENAVELSIVKKVTRRANLLYRSELGSLGNDVSNVRGKSGYFYEYSLKSLNDLVPIINEKFQTITQFGMDAKELQRFVIHNELRGIDRIAPVGKAMDVGIVWDGYDLVRVLSRIVNVEK